MRLSGGHQRQGQKHTNSEGTPHSHLPSG
jgi:hypothetical protein